MGLIRSFARTAALLALATLGSACVLAPARAWNLEQLHQSDGSPRRRGRLYNDFEYLLAQAFRRSNFGGAEFQERGTAEKRISDPQGSCLANVLALARAERDERVAALQAWAFGWLAVDCTYALTRERCALELGPLARDLGVPGMAPLPEGEPLGPEEVKQHFDALVAAARGTPGLAPLSLAEACAQVRALALGREGALRLLRAANGLLERGEGAREVAPLRELRNVLAQRTVALALRAALEDQNGRVRAAALESALLAFPSEREERLRWALAAAMPDVREREQISLRALELVARNGLPPAPAGVPAPDFQRAWERLLVELLALGIDGPHDAAACRALARVTGEPFTLRPEVWKARWRASAAAEPTPADDEGTGTAP